MADTTASPLAEVPAEILSEIFSHACDHFYIDSKGSSPVQITIIHVNRRWRQVALDCARIWATIQIKFNHFHFKDDKAAFDSFCAVWSFVVRCARDNLLDITFYIESRHVMHPMEAAIIAEVLSTSRKWRRAKLIVKPRSPKAVLSQEFAGLQGNIPFLESIVLHVEHSKPIVNIVAEAPLLRHFSFTWRANCVNPPWAQLNSVALRLTRYRVPELRILETCPLLVTLSLQVMDISGPRDSWPRSIVPPLNLQRVTEFSTNWAPWFEDSLILPRLLILNVNQPPFFGPTMDTNHIRPLIERSGCMIRTLTLPRCKTETLADLRTFSGDIQHLIIKTRGYGARPGCFSYEELLYDVDQLPRTFAILSDPDILPALRSLCVSYWSWHPILSLDAIMEELRNLVRARKQRGLERVFVDLETLTDDIDARRSVDLTPPQAATEASPEVLRELQSINDQSDIVINVCHNTEGESLHSTLHSAH